MTRPPLPPFTETARQKVQAAEDAWNTCDPERVAGAYTEDSVWRNRSEFVTGRAEISASSPQVGARAGLRPAQGNVGVRRQPHRGPLPVRVPRRRRASGGAATATSCGSSTPRPNAPPRGQHQRRPDRARATAGSSAPAPSPRATPARRCSSRTGSTTLRGAGPSADRLHAVTLRLYDTAARSVRDFVPIEPGRGVAVPVRRDGPGSAARRSRPLRSRFRRADPLAHRESGYAVTFLPERDRHRRQDHRQGCRRGAAVVGASPRSSSASSPGRTTFSAAHHRRSSHGPPGTSPRWWS